MTYLKKKEKIMAHSKSLLEKYNIPVEHLDFDYVRNCVNVKEIEGMLEILKSGEEGYYQQLTEATENRLRELDPANKMFRVEHKLVRSSHPEYKDVREEVEAFVNKVKLNSDDDIADIQIEQYLPPVRQVNKENTAAEATIHKNSDRIKSCDYDQWEKYDPDTECLKMDLSEEKIREDLLRQKETQKKLVKVVPAANENLIDHLTNAEKETIADRHRLKGNESFRLGEYAMAIAEYTSSLKCNKTAAAFNNRAAANIKMGKYSKALTDCDECLKMEPNNVKAMLRRAEALNVSGQCNDAYRQYARVLEVDPDNSIAKKIMEKIPIRLEIEDVGAGEKAQVKSASKPVSKQSLEKSNDDCDDELRRLIIPKKIVRSKLSQAMSDMKTICSGQKKDKLPNK